MNIQTHIQVWCLETIITNERKGMKQTRGEEREIVVGVALLYICRDHLKRVTKILKEQDKFKHLTNRTEDLNLGLKNLQYDVMHIQDDIESGKRVRY